MRKSLRSVFRKPWDNIWWWFEWFWAPFWSNFDPGGTLGGSLGPPWDTFEPRSQKSIKFSQNERFLDLILETFVHQVFLVFHCSFKLRLGELSKPLFKGFCGHVDSISELVFPTFWRDWKPWKMQPLQCETTVLRYPEIRFFITFPRIFQDKF